VRYADTLLADGERIELRTRRHWVALLVDSRYALVSWLVTVLVLALEIAAAPQGAAGSLLSTILLLSFVIGLVLFLYNAWQYYAQDFLVTNRRVMRVQGVLSKQALDSSLEKINDAELRQSVLGRLLGYGDLQIITASESAVDRFHLIDDPVGFKKTMLQAKHELELEIEGNRPTPPIRVGERAPSGAGGMAPPGGRLADQTGPGPAVAIAAVAPPPAAAPSTPPPEPAAGGPWRADEITRTLGQLADLRDRGAITPQEYEAKKRELLGRL
jgi:Bacterial PH domain/Short C-terminal domain